MYDWCILHIDVHVHVVTASDVNAVRDAQL